MSAGGVQRPDSGHLHRRRAAANPDRKVLKRQLRDRFARRLGTLANVVTCPRPVTPCSLICVLFSRLIVLILITNQKHGGEMPRRPRHWEPDQDLTIGRLAWLAAYPQLHRRSSPWWAAPFRVATASAPPTARYGQTGVPSDRGNIEPELASEALSDRMARYAEPVDRVAARLSTDEQTALRDTGTLPDWFFDAVETERKAERRAHR
jgi:hypothetical protein